MLPPTMDTTMGAAFIGVVVAAVLHGVSCIQAWYYFSHQRDAWHIVLLVIAVMLFDTCHQVLITHTIYTYLVTNYNNVVHLSSLVWSLLVEVLFNGFTALLVQTFLTMRVWRLSNRNVLITFSISVLVASEFACILAFGILSLQLHTFIQLTSLKALSITVNALAAAGDVLIAGTLCILLHKSRTGFQRSDTIINKLILFAVNTGVFTSLCAIASLLSILLAPDTFIYITFFFCLGRLYTNSLLATLNARKMIRAAAEEGNSNTLSLSLQDLAAHSQGRAVRTGIGAHRRSKASMLSIGNRSAARPTATNISIKIDTTREMAVDQASTLDTPVTSTSPSSRSFRLSHSGLQKSFVDKNIGIVVPSREALNNMVGESMSPGSPMSAHTLLQVSSSPSVQSRTTRRSSFPPPGVNIGPTESYVVVPSEVSRYE